jgi:hypothetical protein
VTLNSVARSVICSAVGIAAGAPAPIIIPFVGWPYGWQGVSVLLLLGLVLAYLFGSWIAFRSSYRQTWLGGVLCAIPSLALPVIVTSHDGDPVTWAWFLSALGAFVAGCLAIQVTQKAHAT